MTKVFAMVTNDMPFGVVVNALAHASAGLAAKAAAGGNRLETTDTVDGNGISHPPVVVAEVEVKAGSQEDLRRYRSRAVARGLTVVDFTNTMTGDTYVEQLERTKATAEADLKYYSVVVVAERDQIDGLL